MADQAVKLCNLDEIKEGGSNRFFAERHGKTESFIVVRKDAQAYVYLNSCPHTGAPLDLAPGRFLSPDNSMIMCSTHGAIFRIEDGYCTFGPCAEKSLSAVANVIRDGSIYLSA